MRRNSTGRRLAYTAGKGLVPATPTVTIREVDGDEVTDIALAMGHSPRWSAPGVVVFGPHEDGNLLIAAAPTWGVEPYPLPSGNVITAAAGRVAVSRTDAPGRRVLCSWRGPILGATDPVLSDDGEWLAYALADQPPGQTTLIVERADGEGEPRVMATGDIRNARFGSRTLVWELGPGGMGGCADVGNPHVAPVTFQLPAAWLAYQPTPVWVPNGGALLVVFAADDGHRSHVTVAEWGALERGAVVGYGHADWVSWNSGFELAATPIDGGPFVALDWFDPAGVPAGATIDVRAPRALLQPPAKTAPPPPPPPPPVLPDIPWTPDPTRTVDMLEFVTAASTAFVDRGDGTGELWLHKSPERDDWGENWDWDARFIGFREDRSTGTRMVSQARPKTHSHTNTTRNRLSPEEIEAANARGENLGDYRTLPLAGYTWRGNRVWMIRHVTGHARIDQHTTMVWWDLPEFGGVWETWANLPLTIEVETGYARMNGHEIFARTRYGKPEGDEWNLWGPNGWIGFTAFRGDGTEEIEARRIKAPGDGTGHGKAGPFVAARFAPTYPIYDPAREPKPPTPKPKPTPSPESTVPSYVELRNLEHRLEDTYQHHGHHPLLHKPTYVNPEGEVWREHYFTRRAAGMSHEAAMRSIESQIDVIEGRPDRWATTPAPKPTDPEGPVPPASAIAGRLRVERGRLRNDAGWFQFQGISEFDAIHLARTGQRGEVVRRLRRAATNGRNAVRVLGRARNLFDLHHGQAGYDDALDFVLEQAAALGLYVLYTVGADIVDGADFARALESQARRRRDDPRILWTIVNEARKNGYTEADDPELLALADMLADILGHRDFGISDPLDGDDEHATADMLRRFEAIARRSNILLLHGSRKDEPGRVRWVEHLKGLRDIVDEMVRRTGRDLYGMHEEPMGAAAQREPGRRDNRAAAHVAAACTAAVLGLGFVYHYIAAQSDAVPGLAEAAIAARIPASPEFRYTNANLGGSWVGPVGAWSKIRPAHDGREAWAVGVGSSPGPLNVQAGWQVVETAVAESDGVHCHVWRGERA